MKLLLAALATAAALVVVSAYPVLPRFEVTPDVFMPEGLILDLSARTLDFNHIDIVSVGTGGEGLVRRWRDLYHGIGVREQVSAKQPKYIANAIKGKYGVIRFDGVDDELSTVRPFGRFSGEVHAFVVAARPSPSQGPYPRVLSSAWPGESVDFGNETVKSWVETGPLTAQGRALRFGPRILETSWAVGKGIGLLRIGAGTINERAAHWDAVDVAQIMVFDRKLVGGERETVLQLLRERFELGADAPPHSDDLVFRVDASDENTMTIAGDASALPTVTSWLDISAHGLRTAGSPDLASAAPRLSLNEFGTTSGVQFNENRRNELQWSGIVRRQPGGYHAFVVFKRRFTGNVKNQQYLTSWDGNTVDSSTPPSWRMNTNDPQTQMSATYEQPTLLVQSHWEGHELQDWNIGARPRNSAYASFTAGEILVYDRQLSPDEQADVINHLSRKWDIEPASVIEKGPGFEPTDEPTAAEPTPRPPQICEPCFCSPEPTPDVGPLIVTVTPNEQSVDVCPGEYVYVAIEQGPIDAASVDGAVRVQNLETGQFIAGTTTLVGSELVRFVPAQQLSHDVRYRVIVEGLRNVVGVVDRSDTEFYVSPPTVLTDNKQFYFDWGRQMQVVGRVEIETNNSRHTPQQFTWDDIDAGIEGAFLDVHVIDRFFGEKRGDPVEAFGILALAPDFNMNWDGVLTLWRAKSTIGVPGAQSYKIELTTATPLDDFRHQQTIYLNKNAWDITGFRQKFAHKLASLLPAGVGLYTNLINVTNPDDRGRLGLFEARESFSPALHGIEPGTVYAARNYVFDNEEAVRVESDPLYNEAAFEEHLEIVLRSGPADLATQKLLDALRVIYDEDCPVAELFRSHFQKDNVLQFFASQLLMQSSEVFDRDYLLFIPDCQRAIFLIGEDYERSMGWETQPFRLHSARERHTEGYSSLWRNRLFRRLISDVEFRAELEAEMDRLVSDQAGPWNPQVVSQYVDFWRHKPDEHSTFDMKMQTPDSETTPVQVDSTLADDLNAEWDRIIDTLDDGRTFVDLSLEKPMTFAATPEVFAGGFRVRWTPSAIIHDTEIVRINITMSEGVELQPEISRFYSVVVQLNVTLDRWQPNLNLVSPDYPHAAGVHYLYIRASSRKEPDTLWNEPHNAAYRDDEGQLYPGVFEIDVPPPSL